MSTQRHAYRAGKDSTCPWRIPILLLNSDAEVQTDLLANGHQTADTRWRLSTDYSATRLLALLSQS